MKMSSVAHWEEYLGSAKVSAAAAGGRKQYHYVFKDNLELVEEYDRDTDLLLLRKWRKKKALGGTGAWEVELGEDALPVQADSNLLRASSSNPTFLRQDTLKAFQFRIRNLPYPIETYKLMLEEHKLVLRTTNKKYFKRFEIPDLMRIGAPLELDQVTMQHGNNTLIITYPKPEVLLALEKRLRASRSKMKVTADGDVDCSTS
eukprot:m.28631 g.28631  ORF g.28631 m.28631 type:complete len:203 (+) comp11863_c0_seq1:42-650(+)